MESLLNVSGTLARSRANGPGTRAVIWVQGCTIGCKGCFSSSTHQHNANNLIEPTVLAEWVSSIEGIEGVTISGGEPFEQSTAVAEFLGCIRDHNPDLSVFVYSGYTYDKLQNSKDESVQNLLEHIDLLCAGPYVQSLASESLLWRGSSNQELAYLSDFYDNSMESDWLQQSPVEEYHLDGKVLIHTGFNGKSGKGLEVISRALPMNQR